MGWILHAPLVRLQTGHAELIVSAWWMHFAQKMCPQSVLVAASAWSRQIGHIMP